LPIDSAALGRHTQVMGLARAPVEIVDRRDIDGHLRVSWHPTKRLINVSQWRHGICVATTPVEVSDVPSLISLLVSALEEAATPPPPEAATVDTEPTLSTLGHDARRLVRVRAKALAARPGRRWRARLGQRAGHLAQVIDIRTRPHRPPSETTTDED
jgi:hypothetical protein